MSKIGGFSARLSRDGQLGLLFAYWQRIPANSQEEFFEEITEEYVTGLASKRAWPWW